MITINVTNGELPEEELKHINQRAIMRYPYNTDVQADVEIDGEYLNINYLAQLKPFERIRRVTGYLTTTEKANDGKRAEIADRVKHN